MGEENNDKKNNAPTPPAGEPNKGQAYAAIIGGCIAVKFKLLSSSSELGKSEKLSSD